VDGRNKLGYSAYKVAPNVTQHQAYGVGAYCLFLSDPSVRVHNGFETPVGPGINFHHAMTISLGSGTVDHIINGVGDTALANPVVPHYWVQYP
jgi:hypothetical protein